MSTLMRRGETLGRMPVGRRLAAARKREKRASLFATLTAALFSAAMMAIPWEELAGRPFEDKEVYLERFLHLPSIIDEREIHTFLGFFFNEALWDLTVRRASDVFSVPVVLGAITFLCLFSFARFIMLRHGPLALLLLVNPLLVDFAFSQLRLALAMSLVTITLWMRHRLWALAVIVCACFIHTATILFLSMYAAGLWAERHFQKKRAPAALLGLTLIGIGMAVALAVGPFREAVLNYFGDRRAEYELGPSTLLYASFWIALVAAIPFQGRAFYRDRSHLFAVASVSAFVGATILGVFGARFVAAAYPFAISSLLSLNQPLRQVLLAVFLVYTGAQWYYWFL